jgi:RNA polymerase sigma factor (sigma-70 family)
MLPEPEVERLVRENTGLIGEVLRKTVPRFSMLPGGHTKEDLESLGRRGLVQAAHNYDPSRGVRFSTFAFQCIKNEIIGELSKAINNEVHWISLDTPVGEDEDTLLGDLQEDKDSDTETLVLDNVDSETLRAAIALLSPPRGEIIEDV